MLRKFENHFPEIPESCLITDNTEIIGRVKLGENVSVWYGTMIRGDINWIEIGDNTNIQESCVIHVDFPSEDKPNSGYTRIGKNVTVGHRALIHACEIGDNCLIGMGAIILSGAVIGSGSIVAAGAVVRENQIVPPNSLVVGVPAKIKGEIEENGRKKIELSARRYLEISRRHKESKSF
ncbi:MAG: gamma carbonic anhydrase family protein [Candidatus Rifleibacteriota bacterium]